MKNNRLKSKLKLIYSVRENILFSPYYKVMNFDSRKWRFLKRKIFFDWWRKKNKEWRTAPVKKLRYKKYSKRALIEKRKLKMFYKLSEQKFTKLLNRAARRRGNSKNFFKTSILFRLDMVLLRSNFVRAIDEGRGYISYGLVKVNGKTVNQIDYQVRPNIDIISIDSTIHSRIFFNIYHNIINKDKAFKHKKMPTYLEINYNILEIVVFKNPSINNKSGRKANRKLKRYTREQNKQEQNHLFIKKLNKTVQKTLLPKKNNKNVNKHISKKLIKKKIGWENRKKRRIYKYFFNDFLYPIRLNFNMIWSYKK